ncbi:MAG: zinc-binding dehydrogenase [Chloroflexi bacterium]|nr:zinc-binding dehydrogenase [Chloroflexota bacterium]
MKALYVIEQGGLDKLIWGELETPAIKADEVLVRVKACAMNRRDVFGREGSHGMRAQGAYILGLDLAGDVEAVGAAVTRFKPGDRVLGVAIGGSHAELAKANQGDLQPIPDGMSYAEAAAIPTVYTTAWHMLVCRAGLKPGDDVLVMAGGSGVGTAAIQIAKALSARVITTAGSDDKVAKAKALGADEGINYNTEDFAERVKQLTGGEGVDIVFEHIGVSVWEKCFASLKRGGRFIPCGVTTGHKVQLHLGRLMTRDLSIMGTMMNPREDLAPVMKLISRGVFRPVIHATFPISKAAEAHKVMEEGNFFGKIVLTI